MATDQEISEFWGVGDTWERIQGAAEQAGVSLSEMSIRELAPIDHYHARGFEATVDLANRLPVKPGHHLLDIGCALGGPARYMADRFKCKISGIDITPGYIFAGNELSRITGMENQVELQVGSGTELPYDDNSFDGAYTQHVTMNIADRESFFEEAFRVIKPGGFFGLSEHGLGPAGDPIYPLPWAEDEGMSYLITKQKTEELLRQTGFTNLETIDTGPRYVAAYDKLLTKIQNEGAPILGLHVVGGDDVPKRATNSTRCIKEGRTHPIEVVCHKPA